MNILELLVLLVATTISLLILSKLPIIEIDGIKKAIIAAIVFGILNVVLKPILTGFGLFSFLTFGLATFIANVIIFGLAAFLVQGFRLRSKIWSPIIGAFALTVINSVIVKLIAQFFPVAI